MVDFTPGFNLRNPFNKNDTSPSWTAFGRSGASGGSSFIGPTQHAVSQPTRERMDFQYAKKLKPVRVANQPTSGGYAEQEAQAKASLLAQLANQENDIEAQLGRLGKTRNVGFGNINSAYNQALNRLNEQKAVANRDYQTNTQDTVKGFLGARNDVASQTRARLDAIRQLLGASGSGASSASQYAAPYAAVREGTQRLAPVQGTYATNRRNLDVALGDTMRQYGNEQEDLGQQRYQQRQQLLSGVKQTRADLLEKLNQIGVARAEAQGGNIEDVLAQQGGRRQAINRLLDEILGLGRQFDNPVLRANNINFATPDLGAYDFDEMGEIATDVPGAEDFDPFLAPILSGRDEEDQLLANLVA
jgi:hypothetical protein